MSVHLSAWMTVVFLCLWVFPSVCTETFEIYSLSNF